MIDWQTTRNQNTLYIVYKYNLTLYVQQCSPFHQTQSDESVSFIFWNSVSYECTCVDGLKWLRYAPILFLTFACRRFHFFSPSSWMHVFFSIKENLRHLEFYVFSRSRFLFETRKNCVTFSFVFVPHYFPTVSSFKPRQAVSRKPQASIFRVGQIIDFEWVFEWFKVSVNFYSETVKF